MSSQEDSPLTTSENKNNRASSSSSSSDLVSNKVSIVTSSSGGSTLGRPKTLTGHTRPVTFNADETTLNIIDAQLPHFANKSETIRELIQSSNPEERKRMIQENRDLSRELDHMKELLDEAQEVIQSMKDRQPKQVTNPRQMTREEYLKMIKEATE